MNNIFYKCKSLKNIDLSNFNTQNAINMSYMFYGCNSLIMKILKNIKLSNIINFFYIIIFIKFNFENSLSKIHPLKKYYIIKYFKFYY